MRLDHIAYRVKDRRKTAEFFTSAFGYKIKTELDIRFADETYAKRIVLEPPEKPDIENLHWLIKQYVGPFINNKDGIDDTKFAEFHLPPEIVVSDGAVDSVVGRWVSKRDGVGGIHHMAYQVDDVKKTMNEWKVKKYAEFSSEEPLKSPGLVKIFTKPNELTGVIYEFIEKKENKITYDLKNF